MNQAETVTTGTTTQAAPITAAQILDGDKSTTPQAPSAQPPKPEDEKVSPKLQALIQRERAALDAETRAKKREAEIEARLKEFETREARVKEIEEIKKTNPKKALELLGLSYDELTKVQMADGQVPPEVQIKQLKEELDHFKSQLDMKERSQAEDQKRQEEQKLSQRLEEFKTEISTYVKDNSARYEFIEFEQAHDLVYDVIDEHFERTKNSETGIGEVMTIAQAADKVEAHLEKKYDSARNLNKVKSLLAPKQEQNLLDKLNIQTPSQKPKTLNNNLSATPQKPRTRPLTDEERVAKAIAYARGIRP